MSTMTLGPFTQDGHPAAETTGPSGYKFEAHFRADTGNYVSTPIKFDNRLVSSLLVNAY